MHKLNGFYRFLTEKLLKISLITAVSILFSVAQAGDINHLRGQRYCEVLLGDSGLFSTTFHVYNTIGLNNCPSQLWDKLNAENLKKQMQVSRVHLNGPRYWMIDGMKNSNLINTQQQVFGGISMREAGILKFSLIDSLLNSRPYHLHKIHRHTTWVYEANKPIYEIINSQGQRFVMQSFSTQKIMQTQNSLKDLNSKLHLPKDWHFETHILKKTAYLTAVEETAVVIQDEFLNTYQQETPSFTQGSH